MTGQQAVATSESRERLVHPEAVIAAHERVLSGSAARSRYFEVASGRRIHAIEIGEGKPLVLLHGSGPTALQFLPLLDRLAGVRAIAIDRPGFGLSDPIERGSEDLRKAAVDSVGLILDGLGLTETALLGNSAGGTWALWYALAHPDRVTRLVLLGAPPLLPGTHVPPPLLAVATSSAGPAPETPPPTTEAVIRSMSVLGEGDTIARYPEQLEAMVTAGYDPLLASVRLTELRALIAPTGWQPALAMRSAELHALTVPTLLIWGEQDPLGGADVAATAAAAIPDARLELLPAGHAPWLGHPDWVAAKVRDFVQ